MRRRGNPVTTVRGWKQASLFAREDLKPFLKDRWRWIMDRLREEDRHRRSGGAGGASAKKDDPGAMPVVSGVEVPSHEKERS